MNDFSSKLVCIEEALNRRACKERQQNPVFKKADTECMRKDRVEATRPRTEGQPETSGSRGDG